MPINQQGHVQLSGSLAHTLKQLATEKMNIPIVDLSGISFSQLPKELLLLKGIEELYLDRNGLDELPDWIGELQELRVLSLGRNQIKELPQALSQLTDSLEVLFLGHNQISEIPFPEYDLYSLKHGSIGRNPLGMISRRWMLASDIQEFPQRMAELMPDNLPEPFAAQQFALALDIVRNCPDPMVYEILLQNVRKENGKLIFPEDMPQWQQRMAPEIIAYIPRGTIVDDSLLR